MRNGLIATCLFLSVFASGPTVAQDPSNNGQYYNLKRSYECRRDRRQYGSFYNYGYWQGGRWCGRMMPGGYYVYQDGIWYVWADVRQAPSQTDATDQADAAAQTSDQ